MMDIIKLQITSMTFALLCAGSAVAQEIETFVEPYRAAALSTTGTGVLEQIVLALEGQLYQNLLYFKQRNILLEPEPRNAKAFLIDLHRTSSNDIFVICSYR